jgi:peptide/nickel transport system permease protein
MGRYIVRRLLAAIPVLVGVSVIIFAIMHIVPGDPGELLLASTPGTTPTQVHDLDHKLGVDRPLVEQYWTFVTGAVHLDLGKSYQSGSDAVTHLIAQQFPATLQLTVAALLFGTILGTALGVIAAMYRNSIIDQTSMVLSFAGVSMPSFWLGILLIFVFGVRLGWFPITSANTPHNLAQVLAPRTFPSLVLPAVTLGLALAAGIARLVRSSMLEVLRQEYVTTARAKGLREISVMQRHALRNALIPAVTLIGIQVGALLGGTVITETVFARQGVGRLVIAAIGSKDIPLVQGIVLLLAVIQVLMNLMVDLSYSVLDPRVRYG